MAQSEWLRVNCLAALQQINDTGIVIEGFRSGVMERLGIGPDDLEDTVIFGRITGWKQVARSAKALSTISITLASLGLWQPWEHQARRRHHC